MPASPTYKPVELDSLTGDLDNRSLPGRTKFGSFRYRLNMSVTSDGKACRMPGWNRAFESRSPNNWDLHDQLFGYERQNITMLFEAETTTRFSKLYAGTRNRLYALNNGTGNWKVLSDNYGGDPVPGDPPNCPERRWKAAQVHDIVMFTNGFEPMVYGVIDQPADADNESVQTVYDLDELGITRVKTVFAFGNMVLLMGMEEEGQFYANRIRWSDLDAPTSFLPSNDSVSGYYDLDYGDAIFGVESHANGFYIYTAKGIWEGNLSGETAFSFRRRWWAGESTNQTLAYPNTLVSDGKSHYYWGSDGIYRFDQFIPEPQLVDWMHLASADIFNTLDPARCQIHVGGFNGQNHEIWWSWATPTQGCPGQTMVFNTRFPFASRVDHGFSAFVYSEPDQQLGIRKFIKDYCICTLAELASEGVDFSDEREGGYQCETESDEVCDDTPASWISQTPLVDGELTTEDYSAASPDADSLFAILGDTTIQDLCASEYESDLCNAEKLFLMVSTQDLCIKELDPGTRQRMQCTAFNDCGLYEIHGYKSVLRSNPMHLGVRDDDKQVRRFIIDKNHTPESVPSQISASIGMSGTPEDANLGDNECAILWSDMDPRELECLGEKTSTAHQSAGTRPVNSLDWPLYLKARYFYFEITVDNPNAPAKDTGGIVCFSRVAFDALVSQRSYPT